MGDAEEGGAAPARQGGATRLQVQRAPADGTDEILDADTAAK